MSLKPCMRASVIDSCHRPDIGFHAKSLLVSRCQAAWPKPINTLGFRLFRTVTVRSPPQLDHGATNTQLVWTVSLELVVSGVIVRSTQ